jgi:hypothetical protein
VIAGLQRMLPWIRSGRKCVHSLLKRFPHLLVGGVGVSEGREMPDGVGIEEEAEFGGPRRGGQSEGMAQWSAA